MLLMIDNYDSFTYNLVQYLQVSGRRGAGGAQRCDDGRCEIEKLARRSAS
jgi:anthranilate/para-aminobenzoate synthase component II